MNREVEPKLAAAPYPDRPAVLRAVRQKVRSLLETSPGYAQASPALQHSVAQKMVQVFMLAADLVAEERRLSEQIAQQVPPTIPAAPTAAPSPLPLATAQDAGAHLGLQATQAAGGTIRALKDAIDFPNFVASLIAGVFDATLKSGIHQIESLGSLLEHVSATAEEFSAANIGRGETVRWALERFPFLVAKEAKGAGSTLAVREGKSLDDHQAELQRVLGKEALNIDSSDLEGTLLPLVQRHVGRSKQGNLATLVQLGLQRIVVDEGRLHASMDMRVDTSSLAEQAAQTRFDSRLNAGIGATGAGMGGPWALGATGSLSTTIGVVTSDAQNTQEQLASRAGLRSSVDLAFRTEQIPLDRMAGPDVRAKLDNNSRVPAGVSDGTTSLHQQQQRLTTPDLGPLPEVPKAPDAPALNFESMLNKLGSSPMRTDARTEGTETRPETRPETRQNQSTDGKQPSVESSDGAKDLQ